MSEQRGDVIAALVAEAAATAAGPAADAVDREGRFPHEALEALRRARLLSAFVPVAFGGAGASLCEMADAVRELASHCASSGLVFAMHQIEVAYLARHGTTPALRALLGRVAEEQLLLANANSEVGTGGDVTRSSCALERAGGCYRLEKDALAVSFGAYADAILATARRDRDAAPEDQVLIAALKEDLRLAPISPWDAMGLRGTCSQGFRIEASGDEGLVFPVPFSEIAARTGNPVTWVLLCSVWLGLAEAAAAIAHRYVREKARRAVGTRPVGALRLAELTGHLHAVRALIAQCAQHYEQIKDSDEVAGMAFGLELRTLKVVATTESLAVGIAALGICGLAGYQHSSPYCLERILRDLHGGPVMVSNDRLLEASADLLLVQKQL
jgi:acyl-CoA dehydrogenase